MLALIGALALAYHWWSHREDALLLAQTSPNGFLPVVMPGARPGTVIILRAAELPLGGSAGPASSAPSRS